MHLLLDESLPRRLKYELKGHTISTVPECGWSGAKNGKLLSLAAASFDAFITADQNLQYQQNLASLPIAVVVLAARDNRLDTLLTLVPRLLECLAALQPRTLMRVEPP